jgi:peptide deformylase
MRVTKKNIIALPNEHLRQRSKKIGIVSDTIKQLIADMEAATLDWEDSRKHEVGVALAAIQIDKALRLVVIRSNFNDKSDRSFHAFINPKITKFEGKVEEDFEGCLSVKDIYGKVPRYEKVRVSALDENGRQVRLTAEGFLARVFQHEIDHTNGIMFIDHIKDKKDAFFRLDEEGQLKKLDYAKDIKNSRLLW